MPLLPGTAALGAVEDKRRSAAWFLPLAYTGHRRLHIVPVSPSTPQPSHHTWASAGIFDVRSAILLLTWL